VLIAVAAGIVAGTTNLVAAGAIFGGTMTHGFQMIAAGLLGEQAFSGGLRAAMLGAALRHRALIRHWFVGGVLFGVLAYLVMNVVVVPLSNAANPDFSSSMIVKELLAHTVLFGVPIAGIVRALAPA
jgi:hypothetical protein